MSENYTAGAEAREVIRALTIKQPYASLMLHGKIETRRYPTKVRGKVLICAGKQHYGNIDTALISGPVQVARIEDAINRARHPDWSFLPTGVAIAIGMLVDCRPMEWEDRDKCYVVHDPKLWCWVFEDVKAIQPIPWKGKQGWSILTEEQCKMIKYIQHGKHNAE